MAQVLLVDDDPIFRWVLTACLQELGYEVLQAECLTAGRALLRTARCDVLLLDRILPDGDGMDLLRELAAHGPRLPVIMLSSDLSPDSVEQALAAGAASYLSKPTSRSDLSRAIEQALAELPRGHGS